MPLHLVETNAGTGLIARNRLSVAIFFDWYNHTLACFNLGLLGDLPCFHPNSNHRFSPNTSFGNWFRVYAKRKFDKYLKRELGYENGFQVFKFSIREAEPICTCILISLEHCNVFKIF